METKKILRAGKIASEVRGYSKNIIRKDVPLLEIAEKIERKIIELGGKPAFPVNLSIDEIAAHYTTNHDDKTLARGLLKVDFGVHIDGWIADTAFSLDLENSEENKKLIQASEKALDNAIILIKSRLGKKEVHSINSLTNKDKTIKISNSIKTANKIKDVNNKEISASDNEPNSGLGERVTTSQIGAVIQQTIESFGFSPVTNLNGHEMKKYELHAGITIPNIDDKMDIKIKKGLYAIEPFATSGSGKVKDGKLSGIYILQDTKTPRSLLAREILRFIEEEYKTLPFCSRWLVKKFGAKALLGLKLLEENNNLHQFPQLIESSHKKVSQAEHTILIEEDKKIITTRNEL